MTARYKRVPQTEDNDGGEELKKRRAERIERITSKVHAVFWVAIAIALLSYTNFFNIALTDPRDDPNFHSPWNIMPYITHACILAYLGDAYTIDYCYIFHGTSLLYAFHPLAMLKRFLLKCKY
eukprot:gene8719-18030_t